MTTNPLEMVPNPREHVLYLVLHGLICLVDVGPAGFIAHVLNIGDEHAYLYGNWLAEEEIPKRAKGQDPFRAWLVGVAPGTAQLDPTKNAIVALAQLPVETHSSVRAVISLPRPRCIHQFISGSVDNSVFSDVNKLVGAKAPLSVSAIRVFEYTFPPEKDRTGIEFNDVALTGKDGSVIWKCPAVLAVPKSDPNREVAVLHIYNEPAQDSSESAEADHNLNEFNLSTDFFGIALKLTKAAIVDPKSEPPVVHGLLRGEKDPLSIREKSILDLLVAARSGSDATTTGGSSGPVCNGCNAAVL